RVQEASDWSQCHWDLGLIFPAEFLQPTGMRETAAEDNSASYSGASMGLIIPFGFITPFFVIFFARPGPPNNGDQ
ncbi:MAG: hypothetical protein ACREUM_05990, partial [Nitrosospira sp.]